jgi:hypothetical protein
MPEAVTENTRLLCLRVSALMLPGRGLRVTDGSRLLANGCLRPQACDARWMISTQRDCSSPD